MKLAHVPQESLPPSQTKLEALRRIAPECVVETMDAEGRMRLQIDAVAFREAFGDAIATEQDEHYGFNWVGKQAAKLAAATPTRNTLRPYPQESVDWNNTGNLYIEGDNLEALKLLQRSYRGKVKMIYIDPPYNTGNDYVYRDDFSISQAEYDSASGQVDGMGNRLRRNGDGDQRFHSAWCSMIYSRLVVARSLLTEDGVIFISIDNNEVYNLRKICNEIFGGGGSSNFIAELVWERAFAPKNDARYVSSSHEYVLMYARSLPAFRVGRLPRSPEANARYANPDDDPRGPWMSSDITVKTYNPANDYRITTPSGRVVSPPAGCCWRLSPRTFEERCRDNRIWFGPKGDGVPRIKRFLSELRHEGMVPTSLLFHREVGHSQEGAHEVNRLMGGRFFEGPKPVRLLRRLLTLANLRDDSLILDFFSGSGTTAHAVMQWNAEMGHHCKYICVQLPEDLPPASQARKTGYQNICEIGKERIRRAGKQLCKTLSDTGTTLDVGFRVLKVDTPNEKEINIRPAELRQEALIEHTHRIKRGRSELDLLFSCMLGWGLPLSLPLRKEHIEGEYLYVIGDGELVAWFGGVIRINAVQRIAEYQPLRIALRESSFGNDTEMLNLFEFFKQQCGWSDAEAYERIHVI